MALVLSLGIARLHDYRGWDQSFYLAQTSSLAEDGDVDLRNDLLHLLREPRTLLRALTDLEPSGALTNTFAIGASILWLPSYWVTMPLRADSGSGVARWGRPQLAALHLLTLAWMVWLFWVLDRWLRRMGVDGWLAALGALALVLGTPLMIYGFRAYMGSHQASVVAIVLLLLATLRLGRTGTVGSAWLWGIALGLVFLCRWQDLVKGAVLLVPILQLRGRGLAPGRWLGLATAAGAGALVTGGVQLRAWLLERGEILGLPQGPGYLDLANLEVGRFLFSGLSGLLPWSPLFAVGLIGLLLPWRCRLPVAWRWVALAVLLFDLFLNAAVDDWWGGAAYGPRRMSSDLPLLALGLGNLGSWRRLKVPLATVLAACCLWGLVTTNLRVHGLRDLGILVSGQSSTAPGAEREGGAQPSHAEAVEVAMSWPLSLGEMTYFARRWALGRPLTVAIGAVTCLLVGWLLGRRRSPDRLHVALLAILALALFAQLRLWGADPASDEERRLWSQLGRAAKGRGAAELSPESLYAFERGDDRYADGRRFLSAVALRRKGHNAEARSLVAALGPYPVKPLLLEALSMKQGERSLMARAGFFHQVREERPGRRLLLARRLDLACVELHLTVRVEVGEVGQGTGGPLISVGHGGQTPLAAVEIGGPDRLGLRTNEAFEETAMTWRPRQSYLVQLDWQPATGRARLSTAGPDAESTVLAAPAAAPAGDVGRFEVVVGPASEQAPDFEPPWGARFSDLRLTTKNACG